MLEKDEGVRLGVLCEKYRSTTYSQEEREYPTYSTRGKANCTGHILHRNCFLKHVIEGRIEERIDVTARRRKRCEQILDDLKKIEDTGN
jgi:hypothetical protein